MKKTSLLLLLAFFSISVVFNACKKKEDPAPEDTTITVTENITSNTTWLASKTYVINGEIYVDGCTLTIEPGTTIKFGTNGVIYFGYTGNTTLIAEGTAEKPILFTSSATSPVAGAWVGLWFYSHTLQNSSMSYCKVEYAGTNDWGAISLIGCKMTINNCTVKNAKTLGIDSENDSDFMSFNNNTISDCGTHAMQIQPKTIQKLGNGNVITCASGYGIEVAGGAYNSTTANTWKKQTVPYYVTGTISIDGNLSIEPGAIFKFSADRALEIGYYANTLFTAIGDNDNRITFTTSATNPAP